MTSQESSRRHSWRKLVLELQNQEPQQIELTLTIHTNGNGEQPPAIWGEPRLEWPRPIEERRAILSAAGRHMRRGRLMAAARTLHGRLSERTDPFRYEVWARERALSPGRIEQLRNESSSLPYRPLISIVTPVYNTDARWLRACIESVKNQAYPNWELRCRRRVDQGRNTRGPPGI